MYSFLEKLIPKTLFRRMALLLALILICAQTITAALFHAIQEEPHTKIVASLIDSYAVALTLSLRNSPNHNTLDSLTQFSNQTGLRIFKQTSSKLPGEPASGPFAKQLQKYLVSHYRLTVSFRKRMGNNPVFWVLLQTEYGPYWLEIPTNRIFPAPIAYKWIFRIGFVGFVSLLAALFMMWLINRPLKRLADAAEAIRPSDPNARIQIKGPNEIKRVAETLNAMLNNIRQHAQERTLMLAGISHDLRTPLARIRLEAELMNEHTINSARHGIILDTEEMNAIIGQFLDYTRAEQAEKKIFLDLNTIIQDLLARYTETNYSILPNLNPLPYTCLQPLSIRRLLTNLIDNAIQHGGIKICIETDTIGDKIILSIKDNGPGINPSAMEIIFEPFVRGNLARSGKGGAGLGLAIATRIVKLHQGTITLKNLEPNGLEVKVLFPIQDNCSHN
ncbi:MAG: HAMP domain-containing protein [Pseudomonadota bacterium]|nr:HAMP domain-containing protein [Pseudomonadota bacterium]